MKCTTCGRFGHTSDKCTVDVPKTARARARQWFRDNPSEFLTIEDCVQKFGFSTNHAARQSIYLLRQEGLLRSAHVVFADPDRPRL